MDPNDLLLWMSAKGIGTWGRFRAAVDELQASEDVDQNDDDLAEDAPAQGGFPIHHRLRLNFERLGHAEFFREDFPNGWRVVPPTLACISDELGHIGILCGARTDKVIMGVEERAEDLRLETLAQPECPDRIQVRADKPSQLAQLADAARVHFQPEAARTLLAAIPPIDDSQLETSELPLGNDWDVKRFSAKTLSWATVAPDEARRAPIGLFRIMVHCQPHYYLRLRETTYCVPVQVGKYILLRNERRTVVSYAPKEGEFRTPVSCRPPLLLDRALTLCSGLVPRVSNGLLTYRNVSSTVAITVSGLLRQKP